MKTVFISDGENSIRSAIRFVLEQDPDFKICGEAGYMESLLAQVCQLKPNSILLDWNLPDINHHRLIKAIHTCCPESKLIIMSIKPEQKITVKNYGLNHFLSKQSPPEIFIEDLIQILRTK